MRVQRTAYLVMQYFSYFFLYKLELGKKNLVFYYLYNFHLNILSIYEEFTQISS